ncbi:MAG TPA: hydroxymethylglutaryl-CoA lyase [Chloroflexia bacterium]
MPALPRRVTVYEVGPRDGLQNEKVHVPAADKVRYIDMLSVAGFSAIEATSFVSPRAVPQLADASEVLAAIERVPGVRYPVLVPNEKGMLRALEADVTDVAVFTAASESFTRANINATIAESLANFRPVVALAAQHSIAVRGYVSTAFGCPYEGAVAAEKAREVVLALFDLGVAEVSIGDTIGVGTPNQVYDVIGLVLRDIPAEQLAVHFHDTRGTALANVLAALEMGIATVDSSSAGLGGCPYAPGASGNLATEDLLYMLHGLGIETGVDLEKVVEASRFISGVLNKPPASRYLQAYLAQCA